jgi:hypothetical protein
MKIEEIVLKEDKKNNFNSFLNSKGYGWILELEEDGDSKKSIL